MLYTALLRLDAKVINSILLPAYSGSSLRGAWGHALRAQACRTGQANCTNCPFIFTCDYAVLFETTADQIAVTGQTMPEAPRPYVIHPPTMGERRWDKNERFSFHLLLIGQAINRSNAIVSSWRTALQKGIGAGHGNAELEHVTQLSALGQIPIFSSNSQTITNVIHEPCAPIALKDTITLEFLTPLRIQSQGRPILIDALTPKIFLSSLLRRIDLLCQFHGDKQPNWDSKKILNEAEHIQDEKHLQWTDWQRQSSRQGKKIHLGGYTGAWQWKIPASITQLLAAPLSIGQQVNVGKETTFGMGGFKLIG